MAAVGGDVGGAVEGAPGLARKGMVDGEAGGRREMADIPRFSMCCGVGWAWPGSAVGVGRRLYCCCCCWSLVCWGPWVEGDGGG